MNSSEVAKLLGVSVSTIQRWVKQLELPMERNDRGHYFFKDEDIEMLKNIQEQLQNGVLIHDIAPVKTRNNPRKGAIKTIENDKAIEKLAVRVKELEAGLNNKADSVVSYQLLQHRREIDELSKKVEDLSSQMEKLQAELSGIRKSEQAEKPLVMDNGKVKRKKKNFVSSLFGL